MLVNHINAPLRALLGLDVFVHSMVVDNTSSHDAPKKLNPCVYHAENQPLVDAQLRAAFPVWFPRPEAGAWGRRLIRRALHRYKVSALVSKSVRK